MMTRSLRAALLLPALVLLAGGCARDEAGPAHPVDKLDFPVGVTADPSGEVVWVTSGNFDLAYNGSAVIAIRLSDHAFLPASAAEVGSFAGPFHLLERGGRAVHGYSLSRDENNLHHVTIGGTPGDPVVECDGGERASTGILRCPSSAVVEKVDVSDEEGDDVTLRVGGDPFGALVRPGRVAPDNDELGEPDLLLTGAMVSGNIATYELGADGAPELVGNLDIDNGVYDFAEHPTTRRIYTTTKLVNEFQVLRVNPPDPNETPAATNPWVDLYKRITIPDPEVGSRGRGLAISPDGKRLYASYQSPDSLVVVDISAASQTAPLDRVVSKVAVGRTAGDVAVAPATAGAPELVYVSCFRSDRIDVVDPALGVVVDSILTGRGPFGLAFVENARLGLRRLYVANFNDHSVGVVELDPSSPFYHQQVAEIR